MKYIIKGSTYDVRGEIRKIGFSWDHQNKGWVGENKEGFDSLIAKWRSPGYSVAMSKISDKIWIEEI